MPPTQDLACDPGMGPDWESDRQPFGLQAGPQSTEPHQPGLGPFFNGETTSEKPGWKGILQNNYPVLFRSVN